MTPARAPSPDLPDDEDVIERVLGGDIDAFRIVVERYQLAVLRLARNLAPRGLAYEDIAQDAFVSAFVELGSFDPARGRFSSWLFTIAKNKCINARKKREPILVEELPIAISPTTPADDLAFAEMRERLDAALEALGEDQRTTFVLQELVGLTTDEVAEIEGVAAGTIRSRLSRAKAELRAALAPQSREDT